MIEAARLVRADLMRKGPMYLFLIVARLSGSDAEFRTFLKPAGDEQAAQDIVLADLTGEMEKREQSLEIDVSALVGEYVAEDTLRIPTGVDWMLDRQEWLRSISNPRSQ
ncbi:hypothetical protein WT12_08530 [Burkholderia territorii]|uniref:hypothetical protein n=1 Tax=Burkholderia territorii TaxID=1503055 RepID=UPI0007534AE7|nr:hypothetical protein [Burkholderia territorii]KVN48781.1 hypothetical protein WT12_08530 [Burkholderia territorii]